MKNPEQNNQISVDKDSEKTGWWKDRVNGRQIEYKRIEKLADDIKKDVGKEGT